MQEAQKDSIDSTLKDNRIALQRVSTFVGRTTNWLYDHFLNIRKYKAHVICSKLENRTEFPRLGAWAIDQESVPRRAWRKLTKQRLLPTDIRRMKGLQPHVLHSHFGDQSLFDFDLSQRLEVPWLVSFYGADIYQKTPAESAELYGEMFASARHIVALGPAMLEKLASIGCPRDKIVVHPLGVDVDVIQPRTRNYQSGGTLKILFAGTFREKKGIPYLLDAIARLKNQGVPLELHLVGESAGKLGDEETKRQILNDINRLDLVENTTRYGFLPFHKLLALAYDCHVFVAPSVTAEDGDCEGTPFVLQQMMATAMPVVSTLHSDIPFLLNSNRHLLVPERDAASLYHSLMRFVDDPKYIISDGLEVRREISERFDVVRCGAHLDKIYDTLN